MYYFEDTEKFIYFWGYYLVFNILCKENLILNILLFNLLLELLFYYTW